MYIYIYINLLYIYIYYMHKERDFRIGHANFFPVPRLFNSQRLVGQLERQKMQQVSRRNRERLFASSLELYPLVN